MNHSAIELLQVLVRRPSLPGLLEKDNFF